MPTTSARVSAPPAAGPGTPRPAHARASDQLSPRTRRPGMTGAVAGPCDRAAAACARPSGIGGSGWTLAACILGTSLAFIDGSVVNVALPAVQRDLGASGAELSWAINAYLLPLGALILLGGGAGDHYGRR